jgi:hypothetical protein
VAATLPADVWHIVALFRHYRRGHLPAAGGLLDQPAALMRCFDVLAANWAAEDGRKD